jgi:hypothetical protein
MIINATARLIARANVDKAMELVEATARTTGDLNRVAKPVWDVLFERRPHLCAALVLSLDKAPAVGICNRWKGLKQLDAATLGALLQRNAWYICGALLSKLPPAVRAQLYRERATQSWLRVDVLCALPNAAMRSEEALKALEVPAIKTGGPFQQCPFGALLDWGAADKLCCPFFKGADSAQRAMAASSVMGVALYCSARLPDALAMAVYRKNEQEPVRRELLVRLCTIPIRRWKADHLAAWSEVDPCFLFVHFPFCHPSFMVRHPLLSSWKRHAEERGLEQMFLSHSTCSFAFACLF